MLAVSASHEPPPYAGSSPVTDSVGHGKRPHQGMVALDEMGVLAIGEGNLVPRFRLARPGSLDRALE